MPFPDKAITGHYGTMSEYRRARNMQAHSGTDWSPAGSNKGKTPIPAVAKGTIKLIQWSNVLGWVIVQTAMDKDRKLWYIGYCHVKCGKHGINCKGPKVAGCKSPIKKKVGHKLKVGDTVAIMGNTGNASSGVHLHATLGSTLKSVFGPTSAKKDLYKAIKANAGVAPRPLPVAQSAPPVSAKPVVTPAIATPAPIPKDMPKPAPAVTFYKVQPGDTLGRIALQQGTTIEKLTKDNNIKNANLIRVGQMIRIEK
jgi:murein DD-endopeptidase MepM/ murein hydrolase activator NlpD